MILKNVQRMKLISSNLGYGTFPMSDEEIEQHLTLRNDGRIWLSRYVFGDGWPYRHISTEYYKIDRGLAIEALAKLGSHFLADHMRTFATDISDWTITLFGDDGTVFRENGSMCGVACANIDFSKLLRGIIPADNLFLFEVYCEEDDE